MRPGVSPGTTTRIHIRLRRNPIPTLVDPIILQGGTIGLPRKSSICTGTVPQSTTQDGMDDHKECPLRPSIHPSICSMSRKKTSSMLKLCLLPRMTLLYQRPQPCLIQKFRRGATTLVPATGTIGTGPYLVLLVPPCSRKSLLLQPRPTRQPPTWDQAQACTTNLALTNLSTTLTSTYSKLALSDRPWNAMPVCLIITHPNRDRGSHLVSTTLTWLHGLIFRTPTLVQSPMHQLVYGLLLILCKCTAF